MDTYRRNNRKKQQINVDLNTLLYFLPYWIVSFIAMFILFMFFAVIYMLTPMTQNALPVISRIIVIAIELIIAFFVGRQSSAPGIVSGFIYGLGLTLVILIIGMCSGVLKIFSLELILMLITGVFLGMFGGIAGMNCAPKRYRKRRYLMK